MIKISFAARLTAVLSAVGVLCSGCVNVEYVGQSFPPLASDAPVTVFTPEAPMPSGEYRAIGRVLMTLPDGNGISDARQELINLAREHGAEAVNVVACKRIKVGMNAADNFNNWTPNWDHDDRNDGGAFIYSNSYGQLDSVSTQEREFYELQIKALLVVTNERFKAMEAVYREQRARLEAAVVAPAPDAVAVTPEQAMEQAVQPGTLSPVTERADSPSSERKPVQIELNDSRNPVTL